DWSSDVCSSDLLRLQLGHFALETHDLELLGLHLAVAEKGVLRILGELFHPIAQLRRVNVQVLRCLNIGHASILDQAYSLKLELSRKLPSLHDPPPAPSKHLTRCLRNRVQATCYSLPNICLPLSLEAVPQFPCPGGLENFRSKPSGDHYTRAEIETAAIPMTI